MSYTAAMNDELLSRITIDPDVMRGRPCIRDMRIRVLDVLEMLAGGMSRQDIPADFPDLEDADITAALMFVARATDKGAAEAA